MALNCSYGSMFSAYPWSDESLYSSVKFLNWRVLDGCYPDRNLDDLWNSWSFGNFDEVFGRSGKSNKQETGKADDIIEQLPADPFGMDIQSTFTAITNCIQDFENGFGSDYYGYGLVGGAEGEIGDYRLFAELKWEWDGNGGVGFQPDASMANIDERLIMYHGDSELMVDDGSYDSGFISNETVMEFLNIGYTDNNLVISSQAKECPGCSQVSADDEGNTPHDALFLALGYLGVQDLLSVERVCRSLRNAVIGDPLLWRSIHINQPLSERVTDAELLQLTNRAQGSLKCLSLVACIWITDGGMRQVLQNNPSMTKLSVPGCTRVSVEGILINLRDMKLTGSLRIKCLRVGGLSGTDQQFEELKFLLDADNHMRMKCHIPHFYRGGKPYLTCDDDRAIDIEACPKCQRFGLVFDCPAESCQKKHRDGQVCRACKLCIQRCYYCGCCIKDRNYEESFCLDWLCSDCVR